MMNIILTFCVKPSHSEIDTAAHFHDGDAPVTPLLSVNGIKMVMIGQLVLALRDTSNFLALQTYSLTMSSRIAVSLASFLNILFVFTAPYSVLYTIIAVDSG